jgi:hypothetical protein
MHRRKIEVPWNAETLNNHPTDVIAQIELPHEMRITSNRIRFENSEAGAAAVIAFGDVTIE